jgi:hypothetical protein
MLRPNTKKELERLRRGMRENAKALKFLKVKTEKFEATCNQMRRVMHGSGARRVAYPRLGLMGWLWLNDPVSENPVPDLRS